MSCKPQKVSYVKLCSRPIYHWKPLWNAYLTQPSMVRDVSYLSHCNSQLLWCFIVHSEECQRESACEQSLVLLLSKLDLKEISFAHKLLCVCFHALFPPRIPPCNKERRPCGAVKGLMISGVPPAADVGGMEVNRDEVFSIKLRAYMTDTTNVPEHVQRHYFSCYNELGVSLSFLKAHFPFSMSWWSKRKL